MIQIHSIYILLKDGIMYRFGKKWAFILYKELATKNEYNVKTVWHPVVDPKEFFKHFIKSIKEFNDLFCYAQLNIVAINVTHIKKSYY